MAAFAGFAPEDYDNVFIILDKMDKIGQQGVKEELLAEGYDRDAVEKYLGLFEALADKKDVASGVGYLQETLQDSLDEEVSRNLLEIAAAVETAREADFSLVFDPTLVRGMSYYTGTIFEISIPQFGGSCGGGGRYDEMIGKFTGQSVPACGFSIGFERIILLLLEQGYEIPERPRKVAYLVEKKYPAGDLPKVLTKAKEAREKGQQVLVVRMNKNKKFQKEQLEKEGYSEFVEFFAR
jgi:histidyl-tRNA synthetase